MFLTRVTGVHLGVGVVFLLIFFTFITQHLAIIREMGEMVKQHLSLVMRWDDEGFIIGNYHPEDHQGNHIESKATPDIPKEEKGEERATAASIPTEVALFAFYDNFTNSKSEQIDEQTDGTGQWGEKDQIAALNVEKYNVPLNIMIEHSKVSPQTIIPGEGATIEKNLEEQVPMVEKSSKRSLKAKTPAKEKGEVQSLEELKLGEVVHLFIKTILAAPEPNSKDLLVKGEKNNQSVTCRAIPKHGTQIHYSTNGSAEVILHISGSKSLIAELKRSEKLSEIGKILLSTEKALPETTEESIISMKK